MQRQNVRDLLERELFDDFAAHSLSPIMCARFQSGALAFVVIHSAANQSFRCPNKGAVPPYFHDLKKAAYTLKEHSVSCRLFLKNSGRRKDFLRPGAIPNSLLHLAEANERRADMLSYFGVIDVARS
jgi:hypothetical protein